MKLWFLRPREDLPKEDNPWEPWYDKTFGFVIREETEERARHCAQQAGADELEGGWSMPKGASPRPWLDPHYSTCTELTNKGDPGIVIRDNRDA